MAMGFTTPGGCGLYSKPVSGCYAMKKNILVALALALAALASLIIWHRSGPVMDMRPSSALGEVLAREAETMLGGAGNIVVIGRAADRDNATAGGKQIQSITAALGNRSSLKLIATEWLPPEPSSMMRSGSVTADQLLDLIEKYPAAGVFVVFAGLPPLSPAITENLKSHPVKLMAVCGYSMNTKAWLQEGVLMAAVIPRFAELPSGSPAPKTTQDWFSQEFAMLTPDNAGQWPF